MIQDYDYDSDDDALERAEILAAERHELLLRIGRAKRLGPAAGHGLAEYAWGLTGDLLPWDWGDDGGQVGFYVLTEGGERLPLTRRMLGALKDAVMTLAGCCVAGLHEVRPGGDPDGAPGLLVLGLAVSPAVLDHHHHVPVEVILQPEDLTRMRPVFTVDRRPEGWPP